MAQLIIVLPAIAVTFERGAHIRRQRVEAVDAYPPDWSKWPAKRNGDCPDGSPSPVEKGEYRVFCLYERRSVRIVCEDRKDESPT